MPVLGQYNNRLHLTVAPVTLLAEQASRPGQLTLARARR